MDCVFILTAVVASAVALLVLYAVVSLVIILVYRSDVPTALTPLLSTTGTKKSPFDDGSVVWITGAGSGLGERIAYILAQTSDNVKIILSSRKEEHLEKVAEECRRIHKKRLENSFQKTVSSDELHVFQVKVLPLDLSNLESIPDKVKQAKELFGSSQTKIDVLINAAGVTTRTYCSDSSFELDHYVAKVNYLGPVCLIKQLFPNLPGTIIQLGSIASKLGAPVRSAYSGSKFALHGWLEALGVESVLQGRDIYILNCVLGSIDTGLGSRALINVQSGKIETLQQEDDNIADGLDPEVVAERILAVARQKKRYETWMAIPKELFILYFATYMRHTAFLVLTKTLARQYAVTEDDKKKEG
ncbi:Dehydrogenase/reductase SDR family member 7B [Seminavis robusta]|uniref:Dehydrogenase/reductase SDR family member 7B n=1 Tax=Seminavis robusta TaxID=568900 RepID=A0A9N8EFP4_9STRA|nr:Dehydrogenase/reductase SDR family member 7B [Seminavis robusta]|eukprot:Sro932_g221540.1 Dehydrogenase/reductase SDR family member 7B (359) ;mRNA; f:2743-3819